MNVGITDSTELRRVSGRSTLNKCFRGLNWKSLAQCKEIIFRVYKFTFHAGNHAGRRDTTRNYQLDTMGGKTLAREIWKMEL